MKNVCDKSVWLVKALLLLQNIIASCHDYRMSPGLIL